MSKFYRFFVLTAGAILSITALAKVLSVFSNAPLMLLADPLLGISFRYLLLLAGLVELLIACACLFTTNIRRNIFLIAWVSTSFLAYRAGLWIIDWHRPCHCLGNLTEMLHIPPHLADDIMKGLLLYLLAVSYAGLVWIWRQQHTTHKASHETATA